MRGNTHIIIPADDLDLDDKDLWLESTMLYEWGTKTAKRRFCKTCGILPFYTPRSNPDGFGITLGCIDFGENPPEVIIKYYDGTNWEKSHSATGIAAQSKKGE